MAIFQVAWNETTGTALVQWAGEDNPTGYVIAGTFEYDPEDQSLEGPFKEDHPLFYQVHKVLDNKLNLDELQKVKIKIQ